MELKNGILYLSEIQKKLETIDKNPENVITMFLNKDETVVDLLNLMYRFKFNNKHIDDFLNENFRKINELKDFVVSKSGENISLTLKIFDNAPFKIRCSSNLNNVLIYDIFKGNLIYKAERLEQLINLYLNESNSKIISDEQIDDYIKCNGIKSHEKSYLETFEKYYDKDLSFNERASLAKEYSLFFYNLNIKKSRLSKSKAKYFKNKTFLGVLLRKDKYKKLINENIDFLRDKVIEQSKKSKEDELERIQEKEWISKNKDLIVLSYEKAYNYLKQFI